MADFYLKSGQTVFRANSTAYALGVRMSPLRTDTSSNHAVAKRWVWECTVAGTSGAAVPTWPASVTQDTTTVTDGTVTWRARKAGFSSGTTANWTFASPHLDYLLSGTAAGDRIFVSNNHAESVTATGVTTTATLPGTHASPTYVLCVDDSATPPTALATGASIATTSNSNYALAGVGYLYGVTFNIGTTNIDTTLTIGSTDQSYQYFDNCKLRIVSTGANGRIIFGSTTASTESGSYLRNTTFRFANAAHRCQHQQHKMVMEGGGIESGGTAATLLTTAVSGFDITMTGCNLSGLATAANIMASGAAGVGSVMLRNCTLPASWSGQLAAGDPTHAMCKLSLIQSDNAGQPKRFQFREYTGSVFSELTIKRTAGADHSWRMVSTANAEFPLLPLSSPEIYFYSSAVGSPVTVTVEVVTDNVTLNDQQAWIDVMAMNTTTSTLGTWTPDASLLLQSATNQPTSAEAWTTTGLTTPVKQKLAVTFTPQVAGDFIAIVRLARASTTVYVDPAVTVA
jgi:hypothetical protein